jgi:hypothetical protein
LLQLIGVDFAIWVAALINMSFDVYLEGPQGGIWFWSVVGLGLVLMRVASTAPEPDEMRVLTEEPTRSRRSLMPVPALPAPAFALAGAGATLAPIPLRVAPPPVEVVDVAGVQEAPAPEPEADAVVQPEADAVLQPEADAVVQPEADAVLQPEADAVVQPDPPASRPRRRRTPRPPAGPAAEP